MKRRTFVTTVGTGIVATGLTGCGEGPGARRRSAGERGDRRRISWRLASSFPGSLDILYGWAARFCERVGELTDGAFEIAPYQAGELVPPLEVLDAVGRGSVEVGHSASYYFIGKNPALAFDCTVPFGLTAREQTAWMYDGGGLELMRPLFADFNVVNFPGGNTGVQMGGWFRNPIANLDDLRGRKMRIPGLGGKVMERLGVTAQVIPGGEVYTALERGSIDAAEFVGPYDDLKLGLHEVAPHYYYPGWWEPGAMLSYYVNRTSWESLPSDYRAAVATAAAESNVGMLAGYDAENLQALGTLRKAGAVLHPFPEDVMQQAYDAAREILEEEASADPGYRKVYDAFRSWQRESAGWFDLAEGEYARFMSRRLVQGGQGG